MSSRNEMTSAVLDLRFPHQVIISSRECTGSRTTKISEFGTARSMAPRTHSIVKDDEWYSVFCFSEKTDAEAFQEKFGGEPFDPKLRGRGARWHLLKSKR